MASDGFADAVACYVRVSTEDQSLDRQLESTTEYATERLNATLDDVVTYRDKSTGTDTSRSGYKDMIGDVEEGLYDAVVVHSVSRIARSVRDLDRTVERVVEESDTDLHIISESLQMLSGESDPYQNAMLQLLGVFAELEAEMTRKRVREGIAARQENDDYHHGPAPLGFEKDDGQLIEGDDYHDVVATLEMVASDDLSVRKASQRLDCGRATINRALDRPDLYGL